MGVPSKSNNKKFVCNGINMKLENKIYTSQWKSIMMTIESAQNVCKLDWMELR